MVERSRDHSFTAAEIASGGKDGFNCTVSTTPDFVSLSSAFVTPITLSDAGSVSQLSSVAAHAATKAKTHLICRQNLFRTGAWFTGVIPRVECATA